MVFMFLKFSHGFLRFFMVFMGLCFVSIMFCGPCWSGGPWVGLARGSGGPVGLVGLWVWWACGSGGPVGLMGPWVWWILLVVDC